MSHPLLDLDKGNLKSCESRLGIHMLQDGRVKPPVKPTAELTRELCVYWNPEQVRGDTPPPIVMCGKEVKLFKVKHNSYSRRPTHHMPIRGRNTPDSHGLWRGQWSWVKTGTPQHCPASPAWRTCPCSSKWVCSVTLQWGEDPLFLCLVLPLTRSCSWKFFCITLVLGVVL